MLFRSQLGLCPRKHFYRRLGLQVTNVKDDRIKFIAEMGTAIHELSGSALESVGIVLEREMSVVDEKNRVRGRADLVVRLNESIEVVDVKTERPEAFFRRLNSDAPKVKDHQARQLGFYYHMLKTTKYPDMARGRILYIDRGGGCLDEFGVEFTPEFIERIFQEIATLNDFWEKKLDPPVLDKGQRWQCRFCEFRGACKKRAS